MSYSPVPIPTPGDDYGPAIPTYDVGPGDYSSWSPEVASGLRELHEDLYAGAEPYSQADRDRIAIAIEEAQAERAARWSGMSVRDQLRDVGWQEGPAYVERTPGFWEDAPDRFVRGLRNTGSAVGGAAGTAAGSAGRGFAEGLGIDRNTLLVGGGLLLALLIIRR